MKVRIIDLIAKALGISVKVEGISYGAITKVSEMEDSC
jgi:hypothetical protein